MASAIVGREAELAAVARFLDSLQAGAAALVIEGEAGIGKTTVWREAVRGAESRSLRVLQARPAESEAKLSYAALADLVGDAFDEARAALPAPQERALAAALLRTEPDEAADPRTTATALVGVLTELSSGRPLVVAIDDVQWLDAASARALEFAAPTAAAGRPSADKAGGSGRGSTAGPRPRPRPVRGSPAARRAAAALARVVTPPDRERAREIAHAAAPRAYRRGLRWQSVLRARDRARVAFRRERPRTGRPPARAREPSGARGRARACAACHGAEGRAGCRSAFPTYGGDVGGDLFVGVRRLFSATRG
ncbi:MAG: ATP-binding protein [Actinobacteria bacterium]|nr:ATP-binding protein [Actinomycetota bacterium]